MWAIVRSYPEEGLDIEIEWVASEKQAKEISGEWEATRGVRAYRYTYRKSEKKK